MRMNRLVVVGLSVGLACVVAAQSPTPHSAPAEERVVGPRIIPCSPLLTEMVFQMGLGDCVVAIPRFWTPPEGVELPVIGDRDHIGSETIITLRPDILLVQQNVQDFAAVRELLPEVKIEFFRIETFEDYERALARTAELVGGWSVGRFVGALDSVRSRVADLPAKRVLLGSFYEAFGVSAAGTFHDDMIHAAGGVNAAGDYKGWMVKLDIEGIMKLAPEVIVCQIAEGGEEAARTFFAGIPNVPAVRDGRIFFVIDPRWNVISMHTTEQTAELAEMIHGPLVGERVDMSGGREAFWPMLGLSVASVALLVGGGAMAFLGRRRREGKV